MESDSIYRRVTPQEAYELQSMFPDIQVDYTQFKVYSDNYSQSTKTSCDTSTDTRCEFYIPPKATIIKSWSIDCDVSLVNAGVDVVAAVGAPMTPFAAPNCIERFHILHGNGAGDILYEITNHAHVKFDQVAQGMDKGKASKYGYYKYVDDIDTTLDLTVASPVTTSVLTMGQFAAETGIPTEFSAQVTKIDRERKKKYKHFG